MYNMVLEGYWAVLPFAALAHLPHLKLSPAGVVPQRERRPRLILNYFYPTSNNVNTTSIPLAPSHAMQFGGALNWILQQIVYCNEQYGPPLMAKLDLADGYYRVPLSNLAALQLAIILPGVRKYDKLVGVPLSLLMGWTCSPPYFCSFTETAMDIANATLHNTALPCHPLEQSSQISGFPADPAFHPSAIKPIGLSSLPPLSTVDVYLDDFMALAQPPSHSHTLRSLLHSVDAIFYDSPDTTLQRPVISQSKIQKGDATWSTQKTLLGWLIDTAAMTLTLPRHWRTWLQGLLNELLPRHRISRRRWQQFLGELRSMALAVPGVKFHFSLLQSALTQQWGPRIWITALIRRALLDWSAFLKQLDTPLPLLAVVPRGPDVVTGCDASLQGMGGWIWKPTEPSTVYTWHYPFPAQLQQKLITEDNMVGTLNNSELELAAIVILADLASDLAATTHPMIWCASDNIAAISWFTKGSTSSNSPSAFLLWVLGQLNKERCFTLHAFHVAGNSDTLADLLSHHFDLAWPSLCDPCFPSPTQVSWQLVRPRQEVTSKVLCMLYRQIWEKESLQETHQPSVPLGNSGLPSVPDCNKIPTYTPRWSRRWLHWDAQMPASHQKAPWIYGLPYNWQPMPKRTHHHTGSNQCPSPSYSRPLSITSWPTHPRLKQ